MNLFAEQTSATTATYLRTLPAIRERCSRVYAIAEQGKLEYFDYHPEKEEVAVEYCLALIQREYGMYLDSIPPHGRWSHLDAGRPRVKAMIESWNASSSPPDDVEVCKRLIDLFLCSVLLDAGAGNLWSYTEPGTGATFSRSEGLGVASLYMFQSGVFSGDEKQPFRADAVGLARMTPEKAAECMQVSSSNPMTGIEGRANLLFKLNEALKANPTYFGDEARPGNLLDFLKGESILQGDTRRVHVSALWHVLINGLASIWPASRTQLAGISLGDVWPCPALRQASSCNNEGDDLVPFHKLTGWLTYSLLEPIQKTMGWQFDGLEDLFGLPEYRNGGLLVDCGILALRPDVLPKSYYHLDAAGNDIPKLMPSHPAIVEWRAMTVIVLDRLAQGINAKLGRQLRLAQILESATWKGGREIALQKRPHSGGPPIEIESDGTIF